MQTRMAVVESGVVIEGRMIVVNSEVGCSETWEKIHMYRNCL